MQQQFRFGCETKQVRKARVIHLGGERRQ